MEHEKILPNRNNTRRNINLSEVRARLKATSQTVGRRSNEEAEDPDYDIINRNDWKNGTKPLIPAAVLVALIIRNDGINVLLTKRSSNLKHHTGQISFPGGRVDNKDESSRHTALREIHEEVGIHPKNIKIIDELDEYIVGTGFLVKPFIGIIKPPYKFVKQEQEVAEIFEVPLDFLIAPNNFSQYSKEFNGIPRKHFAITWENYFIWGATAGMLRNLSQRLHRE